MHEHTFVPADNGNHKGAVAEAKIAAAAIELGIPVLKPMSEHGRYDLVFDMAGRLRRVQCKWANRRGDIVVVYLGGSYLSPHGYVRTTYSSDEIDAVAAYCSELDRCFLIPGGLVAGKYMLHLRLGPARNSQRAAINMADDYDLGAIAQLGERSDGIRKVVGSSPTSSTPIASLQSAVNANEFRRRFGWYMQRASSSPAAVSLTSALPRQPPHSRLPRRKRSRRISPSSAALRRR